jgi:hypothetical protein
MRYRKVVYLLLIIALLQITCAKSEGQKMAEASARGDYSYKQYKTADYATAKTALLDLIEFLKRLIASRSAESRTYTIDVMISYVRLAKLEERHGGTDKEKYMAEAALVCKQLNGKTPTVQISQ